jgi:high affinity Mn2+ porin
MRISFAACHGRADLRLRFFPDRIVMRTAQPPASLGQDNVNTKVVPQWPFNWPISLFALSAGLLLDPAPKATAAQAAPAPEAQALSENNPATAQDAVPPNTSPQPSPAAAATTESWAIHGQSTFTEQYHPAFHSGFRGANSLDPGSRGDETFDITLYAGYRPWTGAEIWINPEIDQGFGLSNSFGVAGYLSGEAYKVGEASPYYRLPRAFFRQTIDLGGATEKVDPDLNQLGGTQTSNRVVITVGKYSVVDIFDTNKYAHDPRNDFLNWSIIDNGSFDYAAEAWGYTYGATAEWYQDWWTIRAGLFDISANPNDKYLDNRFISQTQLDLELEERHTLWDQPGKLKFLYWLTRGRLGSYAEATALALATGTPANTATRDYRSKFGVGLNLEQQLTEDLGMFMRIGWSQGSVEEVDFTDINQTISLGLSLAGTKWGRPDDTVGLAGVANQISHQGKQFLNAGGLGGIIGDGALPQAGPEQIIEAYYSLAALNYGHITADYQFVNNPGYNRDCGPVSVLALRLHAQF